MRVRRAVGPTTWAALLVSLACSGEEPAGPARGASRAARPLAGSAPGAALDAASDVFVKLKHNATLADGGRELLVEVKAGCRPVGEVLEAFVQVSQDDQTIFGEGFIDIRQCDGKTRKYPVRVQTFEGAFHPGEGFASAFVLVCDEEGSSCAQSQDFGPIRIRS
jgi:hypothetical protein